MVENASRRFSSSCDRAMHDPTTMVMDAMTATTIPRLNDASSYTPKIPVITRTMLNTPTFTTATACSSADTGVGATMAAGSHE